MTIEAVAKGNTLEYIGICVKRCSIKLALKLDLKLNLLFLWLERFNPEIKLIFLKVAISNILFMQRSFLFVD